MENIEALGACRAIEEQDPADVLAFESVSPWSFAAKSDASVPVPRAPASRGAVWFSWTSGLARRRRAAALALAAGVAFLTGAPAVIAQEAGNPTAATQAADFVQAQTLEQVVKGWSPDKSVYVIGELSRTPIRIDPQTLRDLARELNGKHWTVVIVVDASNFAGERCRRQDARRR